jgi:hypothetical protein
MLCCNLLDEQGFFADSSLFLRWIRRASGTFCRSESLDNCGLPVIAWQNGTLSGVGCAELCT